VSGVAQETKLVEETSEEQLHGFKAFLEAQTLCRSQAGIPLFLAGTMFF